jgi:hypothetical protein
MAISIYRVKLQNSSINQELKTFKDIFGKPTKEGIFSKLEKRKRFEDIRESYFEFIKLLEKILGRKLN